MIRRHPLDIRFQPPRTIVPAVAGLASVAMVAAGLVVHTRNTAQRVEHVRQAVLAAGYGVATVQPLRGSACWRGRAGFTWRSATASGSACAGPRAEVRLLPGEDRPHL
jgi:hypothetical protein